MTPETCNSPDTSSNISGTEEAQAVNVAALGALSRAYEAEHAAQMGEPNPWSVIDEGERDDAWVLERLACAQAAADAYLSAILQSDIVALMERLDGCASRLEALTTLPKPYDLYYAVKKENEPGWSYHCAHIGVDDIRAAASLILSQSSTIASAREVIEQVVSWLSDEYADVPNAVSVTLTFDDGEEVVSMPFGNFRAAREWKGQ